MSDSTKRILYLLVSLSLAAVVTLGDVDKTKTIAVSDFQVKIEEDLGLFQVEHQIRKIEEDLEIVTLTIKAKNVSSPPEFNLKWSMPAHNISGRWSADSYLRKTLGPDWYPSRVVSRLARNAPVLQLFGADDANRLTVAVSDALNTLELSAGVREEDGRVYWNIRFFPEKHRTISEYRVEIRFDGRAVPFSRSLQDVAVWWSTFDGYEPAPVPAPARMPMYSTWYSYHQQVEADALVKEAAAAREMGFTAIIVDDGWQTLDNNRGYAYTGDWHPDRIPEMKAFVDAVHALDMKFLLWYSVPLVGEKSDIFKKFQGKYLRYWDGQGAYELDPRYPEVRTHLIDLYRRAMREWGVDGFKFDFLARFIANDQTDLTKTDGRDYASVNEAADRLMTDIITQLRRLNPEVMIEFRQPYIGPLMRKFGNMFRVGDCPNVYLANRVGMVDLRLLSGDTAVHSDMLMWHYDDRVEVAALQLLNVMFSVPQISVRLADIPVSHFEMIRFYIDYWKKNQAVLLSGEIGARDPLGNYPVVTAASGEKRITALYADEPLVLDRARIRREFDVINGKLSERVLIEALEELGTYQYSVHDCRGRLVREDTLVLKKGVYSIPVPASGMLTFRGE